MNSITPAVRDFLALQRLDEIFPPKTAVDLESSVQARAALIPINGSKVPCLMSYRTLNIGIGSDMELDLSAYGHCNYASSKHASLYFDQYAQVRNGRTIEQTTNFFPAKLFGKKKCSVISQDGSNEATEMVTRVCKIFIPKISSGIFQRFLRAEF